MSTATATKPPRGPKTEELVGEYAGTRWSSDDRTFLIGALRDGTIVKGNADAGKLIPGGSYRFLGKWQEHPKYGRQFAFSTFVESEPHTYHGVIEYLLRNTNRVGIGRATAHALVDAFGADKVIGILKRNPETVPAVVPRVTAKMAQRASQQLIAVEQFEQTKIDLLDLFAGRGFPASIVDWCVRRFGVLGPKRLRHDPFTLLVEQAPGCGFLRVDGLYQELGLPLDRLKRQAICVWHVMRSDMSGSVWFRRDWIENRVRELVSGELRIDRAITLAVRARMVEVKIVDGVEWMACAQDARDERQVCEYLQRIVAAKGTGVQWPQLAGAFDGDRITDHQVAGLEAATAGNVGLLTGLPGTGKSFSLARLVGLLPPGRVALAAPTGRAAVRMMESMAQYGYEQLHASTIHSLLGITRNGHDGDGWGFLHNEHNPLPADFIIIDESSMIPNSLMASLLSAVRPGACILFIGDPNQLPPVGAGRPFLDMIEAGLPHGHLSEVHRYAGRIAQVCKAINDGQPWQPSPQVDLDPANGFPENLRHIERGNPALQIAALKTVVEKVVSGRGKNPIWDLQVLCAVNDKSPVCRKKLNESLQALLNPDGESLPNNPFRVGDKAMCLKNGFRVEHWEGEKPDHVWEHYVANGEIGRVEAIDANWIAVKFAGKAATIRFWRGEWSEIDLAYACTVHKAQGSGFPVVVVMLDGSGGAEFVCSRAHHYTAISRASELCITIGKRSVLDEHCRKVDTERRVTFLTEGIRTWLQQ